MLSRIVRHSLWLVPVSLSATLACGGRSHRIGGEFPSDPGSAGNGGSGVTGAAGASTGGGSGTGGCRCDGSRPEPTCSCPAHTGGSGGASGASAAGGTGASAGTSGAAGTSASGGASGEADAGGTSGTSGSAGASGSAGMGGAPCTVHVPGDFATIDEAVNAATVPGVVCVDPGAYAGPTLRAGVSIRGTGPGVVLCTETNALLATSDAPTNIENLDLPFSFQIVEFSQVSLRDLRVGDASDADACKGFPPATPAGVNLKSGQASDVTISVENLTFASSQGIGIGLTLPISTVHDQVSVTRSRCVNAFQCFDLVHLSVDTSPNTPTPNASRFDVDISNNVMQHTVLEGIEFAASDLPDEVLANSTLLIRNNTILSDGDNNYGIVFWNMQIPATIVANNVVSYMGNPVWVGNVTPTLVSNALSQTADSKAWFQDFDHGDYRPAAGSPLIGAADPSYAPDVDVDGSPRSAPSDIGAYQH